MLVDTIGFVSKLPHNLINSFYQTLQEIKNADLIIHVCDSSSQYINEQLNVVLEVLYYLNASNIPTIYLLNKWDNTIDQNMTIPGHKSIQYSNKTLYNLDFLLESILEEISPSTIHVKLLIPYKCGNLTNILEEKATIYHKDYQGNGTYYDVELPIKLYSQFKDYDIENFIS